MSVIDKLLEFLGIKKTSLSSISKKSDKIFDVFTKTKTDAEALNVEIVKITTAKKAEAQKLLDEVKEMELVAAKNEALAKKIEAFITT